jgi:hypothetical protein
MEDSVRWMRGLGFALVLVGVSAGAAQAQSHTARLSLPHEVRWGAATLPAGDYRLTMDTIAGPLSVIDASGQIRALLRGVPDSPMASQPASLLITRDGSVRTVRSFNCPAWGTKFVYKPISRSERALLADAAAAETVPVRVASR